MNLSRTTKLAEKSRWRSAASILLLASASAVQAADEVPALFRQSCFGCHGKARPMGGISLTDLTAKASVGEQFQQWEKVAHALEDKRMPPPKLPQPSDEARKEAVAWIRGKLTDYAKKHDGEPGKVTVRRLTSGEYAYTIEDLTGIDLNFDRDFTNDSVGGEGFTNFGDVQFMQDANLERYLEAAKRIADHAVVGAGPLKFFEHPGQMGMELSAVNRIQQVYRAQGFRAVAGEGAKPFGLDRYSKAFYAAWRYQHRAAFGEPKATLEEIAAREGITPRFARHIWTNVTQPSPTYPISDVAARFKQFPAPGADKKAAETAARAASEELRTFVIDWTRWLFAAGPMESAVGDDRVFVLSDESLKTSLKQNMRFFGRGLGAQKTLRIYLTTRAMNPNSKSQPRVIWKNGTIGEARRERGTPAPRTPIKSVLSQADIERLGFEGDQFVMRGDSVTYIDVPIPDSARQAPRSTDKGANQRGSFLDLQFDVEIEGAEAGDAVMRATISNKEKVSEGRTTPVLLGNPGHPGVKLWTAGLLAFADRMPINSHGEPTPSDRDPIPPPFNTAYNQPERDHYHIKLKYYRTDKFLYDHVLNDAERTKLDQAWNDLFAAFDYHDEFLRFVANKYKFDLGKKTIDTLLESDIQAFPAESRKYVKELKAHYDAVQQSQRAARTRHVSDVLEFASNAWRRPLTPAEKERLRAFYTKLRQGPEIEHSKAIRSLIARVLVSPAFLYRLEKPSVQTTATRPLSDWELAGRLSYFLWSSAPDKELRRAAAAGELKNPEKLREQAKRMLADPKARRFSTEFFGQWLGFYRFDQFTGVDTGRFPEFTDEVKSAMYDEAVTFFEHIVRKDRPVREMISANYTFLNAPLAKHYGIKAEKLSKDVMQLVESANTFHRGGMLRLGAVLTTTSAPLRTSPVKRGDWMLRRVLGTPTPPPPADAGSIPADPKAFGGLTLFEKLEAHKRNPTCAGCHNRIDPLGFPFERYDAVGRWRETYSDGKPVHDSAAIGETTKIAGIEGLLDYLQTQEKQVLKTMSQKLLGFALGRTVLASDQLLIEKLTQDGGDTTLSNMIGEIVASKQFRYRREELEGSQAKPAAAPPKRTAATTPAKKSSETEGGL